VVHPTALGVEAAHLAGAGVPDPLSRVTISARARVITPFHQAANRLREIARGRGRHGSCGVGVGEAVADALAWPGEALVMADLRDARRTRSALLRIQERKRAELSAVVEVARGEAGAEGEIAVLEDRGVADRWCEAVSPVLERATVVDDAWLGGALREAGAVVFEGAQGVLLDEHLGFHPHTTWSTCTFAGALALLRAHDFPGEVARIGVARAYTVRHGAGPLPTEDAGLSALLPEPHNQHGPWQGPVRRGWPDALLLRYAAEACGGIDALALTHLDALPRLPSWQVCRAYRLPGAAPDLFATDPRDPRLAVAIHPPSAPDLARQEALGSALSAAVPVHAPASFTDEGSEARAIAFFEEAVGAEVRMASHGPSAAKVRARGGLFPRRG
jgi:adenylosuccinate synthase